MRSICQRMVDQPLPTDFLRPHVLNGNPKRCSLSISRPPSHQRIPEIVRRAKDKNDPYRLMGFGHRVYKSYDPRAKVLRQRCYEVLDALGQRNDPLLELVMELERVVLADDYFIERKLYPNVDFYSGIIFRAGPAVGDVHAGVRGGAHRRLGRALERDDRRPRDAAR